MKYKKKIVYYAIIAWCLYYLLERQKGRSTFDVITIPNSVLQIK